MKTTTLYILLLLLAMPTLAEPPERSKPDLEGRRRSTPAGPASPGFTVGGQIHFQFDDGNLGSSSPSESQPAFNGIAPHPAADHLNIRRFRPNMRWRPDSQTEVYFLTDWDTVNNDPAILEYWIRTPLAEGTQLLLGQFKPRWGFEGLRRVWSVNTIEMSDASRYLYHGRDLGIGLDMEYRPVHLSLAVLGGQGLNKSDTNSGKDLLTRATFDLNDQIVVGVSSHTGSFRPPAANFDLPVSRQNVELRYYNGPWTLESELMWSRGYNSLTAGDTPARGGYVSALYQFDERWDGVMSFDWFDPDTGRMNELVADNRQNSRNRLVFGANYYLDREAYHRFMLNYELHNETEGPKVSNNGFRLRYQYRF